MTANDEYDPEEKLEPTCSVWIDFTDRSEAVTFTNIVTKFCQDHAIPKSPLILIPAQSTPDFPMHPIHRNTGLSVVMRTYLGTETTPYCQGRLSVLRRSFPEAEFKRLADDFEKRFQSNFPNRVRFDIAPHGEATTEME